MKIGDIVCRKKYGKDICFEITDIKDGVYYLTGIEYRLVADSEENDLELSDFSSEKSDIIVENKPCLKGTVLHIDGDKHYLDMCLKKYAEFNINVHGYYMKENEIKDQIIPLLEKHRPNLLVITGHDAMKKNGDRKNINSYLHTKDFVEAIRKARLYEDDKDSLIIFAGACQSYYELLLASGANFASSPSRKNIHALDPVFVVSQIANASIKNYVDLEKIVAKTSNKHLGVGGIDTRGVARKYIQQAGEVMKVRAYAKINLALDVLRKREDGYHELEMIMAPITLHDLIYINTISEDEIKIESNSTIMPTDERNIMYKIAALMKERYGIRKGVNIYVYKHIPTQAGLAGGSADGAAVIKAMNKLFYLGLSYEEMAALGKEVGADIPFCIYQKTALVGGVGEKLEFIDKPFECKVLLVKPKKGVSTKKSFGNLDLNTAIHRDCHLMKKGIEENDYQAVIDNLQNTLEAPSIKMVPEIETIKQEMLKIGFDGALMSGSGSCVFGLTRSNMILEKGFKHFKGEYYFVRKTEILNEEEIG